MVKVLRSCSACSLRLMTLSTLQRDCAGQVKVMWWAAGRGQREAPAWQAGLELLSTIVFRIDFIRFFGDAPSSLRSLRAATWPGESHFRETWWKPSFAHPGLQDRLSILQSHAPFHSRRINNGHGRSLHVRHCVACSCTIDCSKLRIEALDLS